MPELPDVEAYRDALAARIRGQRLLAIRLGSPFLLRSVEPAPREAEGRAVEGVRRLGKRIVIALEGEVHMVLHLMIAGRLHWHDQPGRKLARGKRPTLLALDFERGSVTLTEAGSERRAWLRLVRGEASLRALDPGGLDVLAASFEQFRERLTAESHTVKRALTDPRLLDGIGNAYSDEILFAARLAPTAWTTRLDEAALRRLYDACRETLTAWCERLCREAADAFPEGVTAFRDGMAVHGRYREPCPRCGAKVQRIRYASRETNYCAPCQTGGKLLRDRSLSVLLKGDWPASLADLELGERRP